MYNISVDGDNKMSKLNYGRGYVYSIKYHVVWCTKYRHDVLIGDVSKDLKLILKEIASNNSIYIVEMETDKDHIHMLIECRPQHYIPNFIKAFKGVSARKLFKKHPHLKDKLWGGHLWNPSYFVATVSEHSESQIKEYIKNQQKR